MELRQYNNKEKIMIPVLSILGYSYFFIMDNTIKKKLINYNPNLSPVIYAIWHGWQYGLISLPNRSNTYILISPSNDGDIITRITDKLGFKAIRGSKGRRGTEALREILKTIKKGGSIAYTVDGPKGPIHKVKEGIIHIAQMSQIPIIPVVPAAKHNIRANSWDHYRISLFFEKVITVFGDPIYVPRDITEEQREGYRLQVENKLFELEKAAESAVR